MHCKQLILVLIALFTGSWYSYGVTEDSLVKFSDLVFKTSFEKQTFKNYQNSAAGTDVLDLFLNSFSATEGYSSEKAHEQINDCVKVLKKETAGMSQEKAVKEIYKYVHKRFFKVYNLKNSFSDVFEKGEYNCVSGSAMYAIIFGMMDIPYQIMELPRHVFLITYPKTHKIYIETTIPVNGYFTFPETYVKKYINYLLLTKMISSEEVAATNPTDLFNKYYFKQKGLTIQELAGIQYANYAVYYSENSEYEKAAVEIKKAYYIAPYDRHQYMMIDGMKQVVSADDYKTEKNIANLAILCRYNQQNQNEVSNENVKYEFARVMHAQLISQSDDDLFERSYKTIRTSVADTVLQKEIDFMYHYERARVGYNKFKDKDFEMPELKAAYRANSKDSDLQQLILAFLNRQVELNSSVVNIMQLLEDFRINFGFLDGHAAFNSVKSNCYLELAYESLMMNQVSKGEKYLADFEKLCDGNKDIKAGDRFVEKAYSTAATYYYKKGNISKTRQLLKKGIEYAPENFGLKIRLNQLH